MNDEIKAENREAFGSSVDSRVVFGTIPTHDRNQPCIEKDI